MAIGMNIKSYKPRKSAGDMNVIFRIGMPGPEPGATSARHCKTREPLARDHTTSNQLYINPAVQTGHGLGHRRKKPQEDNTIDLTCRLCVVVCKTTQVEEAELKLVDLD
jgi:hypothetical protein